jgi:TonB family protein
VLTIRWTRCPQGVAGAIASLAFIAIAPSLAAAQGAAAPGTILISVRDSSGTRIAGAQVSVRGTELYGVTDEQGQLQLRSIQPGRVRLDVRRLGFRPTALDVTVAGKATTETDVTLVRVAQQLSPVLIRGTAGDFPARMAGFFDRRDKGIGRFLMRQEIEKGNPSELTDVFRRLPSVRVVSTASIRHAIRLRGQRCAPLVWMDGFPLTAAEFDLDLVAPETVEAIEVYSGVSEVPARFMGPQGLGSCGVIVIWSRHTDLRPNRGQRNGVNASAVAALVASLKVYTADEVDTPARPDTTAPARPAYPAMLFAEGVNGKVTAEFVVDTTGRVVMETFNVISSSDAAFTAAVRDALPTATYIPALLHGHPVKQVVHQPFNFVVDSAARSRT